ncbi:hypothetical protein QUB80_29825 [Chlorogloeopsis sp. ULAP01]|uniref:hypothetical protein n=1 Tax=Chlorogloeopsis sp. ULAP01 TaxID=3056483 RepID=UPI0025AA4AC9|nr:hypothetical protein [Chlorogloeopsis sp. ULAP01]MDM9384861.1 hypothetical protein [Chlorogloeopsis sp. ULAP01]
MATSDRSSARLRSATEFPKTINNLSRPQANQLYEEMRDCLIFTNRSRSQLLRRREEDKQSTLRLKADVERLQTMISQLKLEKEQLANSNRQIVTELEHEIGSMAGHLDELAAAFDSVADIDNPNQTQWSYLAFPSRFFKFIRAIKAIVLWWREEKGEEQEAIEVTNQINDDEDRNDKPQMYTDPASQGRSLLDR